MRVSYLGEIIGWRNAGIGYLCAQQGLELEHLWVKKALQCTHTMGGSAPTLHREITDFLINRYKQTKSLLTMIGGAYSRLPQ